MPPALHYASLFVLSIALSLFGSSLLGFDLDEMATAAWVLSRDLPDLYSQISAAQEGNAIGYPFFIYFWGKLSQDALWLRLPSVLAASATCLLFYRRYSREMRKEAAFLGALFLTSASLWLTQAQNARCYALFAFFSFWAFLAYERMEQSKGDMRAVASFSIASLIALSLHHFAILFLLPLWIRSFHAFTKRLAPKAHLLPILLAVLFYLPQISFLARQWRFGPQWIPVLTPARGAEGLWNIIFLHHWFPTVTVGTLALWGTILAARKGRMELAWTITPFLVCVLISLSARSLFVERYFLPSLVGFFAFFSFGLDDLLSRKWGGKSITAIALCSALLIPARLPAFYAHSKDADFRGAAAHVKKHEGKCGNKVVTDLRLVRRWPYYLPRAEITGWGTSLPPRPYWLIQAGYEIPDYLQPTLQGAKLRWNGNNAVAACVE